MRDHAEERVFRRVGLHQLLRAMLYDALERLGMQFQRALELHAQSLERVVQHRTQELVQANAAKDTFLGMVSHELSMPLTSLAGRAHLLRRHLERADADDLVSLGLEGIEGAIGRLEVLVTDLLDASLIRTNRVVFPRERCDLAER